MRTYSNRTRGDDHHPPSGKQPQHRQPMSGDPTTAMRVGLATGLALLAGLAALAFLVPASPDFPAETRTLLMVIMGGTAGLMFLHAGFLYTKTRG